MNFKLSHNFNHESVNTVPARNVDLHKINNTSCNYLGSFFIKNLNLRKHLINLKTAVHTTVTSK
jgi:hypothetical protein